MTLPRERRAILLGIGILVLLLLVVGVVQAERSRTQLAAELPSLRASVAALERDAEEVKRLRALPARAAAAPGSPLASLATNAGGVAGAQIVVLDDRRVRLTGGDVAFTALLEWIEAARASHGMRVESAKLEALAAAGRVRAEVVLARS